MVRLTVQFTEPLFHIIEEIQLRERYRSPSEVCHAFLRYWATSQQEHRLTGEWSTLTTRDREALDSACWSRVKSSDGRNGGWIKQCIAGAILAHTNNEPLITFPVDDGPARLTVKRPSINLTDPQLYILHEIQRRERYRSPSEVFQSFVRFWALMQPDHAETATWAAMTARQRDELDTQLAEMVRTGKTRHGSWLKAQIIDAIKSNGTDVRIPLEDILIRLPQTVRHALLTRS